MRSSVNPVRVVLYGGYPPGTAANARPYGMPPFSHTLDDGEIGQVVSFIRTAWGNDAGLVTANEVAAQRVGPLW
jgi:mono/diheme cytochrome c family protein